MPALRLLVLTLLLPFPLAGVLRGDDRATAYEEGVLKDAGIGSDGPALLEFFRKRTLSDAEQAKIADTVRRLGDVSFATREKATIDLIALGRVTRPYLRAVLMDRDPELVRRAERCLAAVEGGAGITVPMAVARLLAVKQPEGSVEVILNYLPLADDELLDAELIATLLVVGIRAGKPDPALPAALKDGKASRRGAAALVLGRQTDPEHRALVRPLLKDEDAKVRLRAAEALIRGKEKEAIAVLVALLDDAPLAVAWSAEDLLSRIAADKSPQVWLRAGGEAQRKKCRDAWDAWWRAAAPQFDVAKLDLDQRLLGLTLICACDGYNQATGTPGRVWEVGPDGKPRWEINAANYPVDAQVLPGNRVLIAEQSGRKVTERGIDGKVIWEHAVNDSLVSCQRLQTGNTFIATYREVFEVTPEGKVLYKYAGGPGSIYAAQRLRNGHIAYLGSNGTFVELDETGKELRSMKVSPAQTGLVKFEVLAGGRILVGQQEKVVELDGEGKVLWECTFANANSVMRMPNGNTLASSYTTRRVAEFDRGGKLVWEQKLEGGPLQAHRR
ncbi:MAG: PQQ-binding-like beta-propeller repeat protein [Gemmataceae bacterium]|nr:PQQ-binding-like beta-propeller repeat protein [Gemmataceae bacterium]